MEQEERSFKSQDIFVNWNQQDKFEKTDNTEKKSEVKEDIVINEVKNTKIYKRYYHIFKEGELEALITQIKSVKIVHSYFDHANWSCIVEKLY